MKKRILCMMLAVCMMASMFPAVTAGASTSLTAAQVTSKLDNIKANTYPDGSSYTGSFGGGSQCYAFGRLLANMVFGSYPWNCSAYSDGYTDSNGWTLKKAPSNSYTVEPGDLIEVRPTNGLSDHTAIVWKVSGSTIYVAECWGSSGGEVNWGFFNDSSANSTLAGIKNTYGSSNVYVWKRPGATTATIVEPGKPVLLNMKSEYAVGESVVLTWNSTTDTVHYAAFLDKLDSDGDWERIYGENYVNSGLTFSDLEAGSYRTFVHAVNPNYLDEDGQWLYTSSDIVYFDVIEEVVDDGLSGQCGDNVYWEFDENTGTLTISGTGDMWDYLLGGTPWDGAFAESIKSIVVMEGVTGVCSYAFSECGSSLNDVTLPKSIVRIGEYAFAGCTNLKWIYISDLSAWCNIDFGSTWTTTHNLCLNGGIIFSLIIPDNITKIKNYAFNCCNWIESVTIHDSVTSIGKFAFYRCGSLKEIYFEGDAPSINTASFPDDVTLYYIPGMSGWTDSSAYDSASGTWNGYKLEPWGEVEDEEPAPDEEEETPVPDEEEEEEPVPDEDEEETPAPDDGDKEETPAPDDGGKEDSSKPDDEEISYSDVKANDWYYEDVMFASEQSLMNGVGDGRFAPNEKTSRAMVVTILWRMQGSPKVYGGENFSDVASGQWYENAVKWAAMKGIVTGYGNGKFGPNDYVTREQLAVMLYRYEKYVSGSANHNVTLSFADTGKIDSWAYDACAWCYKNGIISGKPGNLLDPLGTATRAELAAMLHRYIGK